MERPEKRARKGGVPRAFVFLPLALAILGLGLFFGLRSVLARPPVGVEVGYTAPDFSLPDLQGTEVHLSQFRGKVVLLYFWQSTCPDCHKALVELFRLREMFGNRRLALVTVNLDYYEQDLHNYLAKLGTSDLFILRGSYEQAMKIVDLFEVPLVPHVVLLDRRGVIRFRGTYPNFPKPKDVEQWL